MKLQAVRFQRTEDAPWETGFAIVECFNLSSIRDILTQDGKLLGSEGPWDYHLFCDQPGHMAEIHDKWLPTVSSKTTIPYHLGNTTTA